MSAVQVVRVGASAFQCAVVTSVVATTCPQAAAAKTNFTQVDLSVVELGEEDVSPAMRAPSFTIATVLPWLEQVRDEAAKALAEM